VTEATPLQAIEILRGSASVQALGARPRAPPQALSVRTTLVRVATQPLGPALQRARQVGPGERTLAQARVSTLGRCGSATERTGVAAGGWCGARLSLWVRPPRITRRDVEIVSAAVKRRPTSVGSECAATRRAVTQPAFSVIRRSGMRGVAATPATTSRISVDSGRAGSRRTLSVAATTPMTTILASAARATQPGESSSIRTVIL
jgi:hypothetical protein